MNTNTGWLLLYTTASGALRVAHESDSESAARNRMRYERKNLPEFVDLMAPWYIAPATSVQRASVGGTYDESALILVHAKATGGGL